jgi:hypothetical protein
MHESERPHPYQVAHEFLESALHLYFERKAYSAALHLAGAAEELLGKLLREQDGTPYLDFLQRIMMDAWSELTSERSVQTTDGKPMSPTSIATFLNSARNHVKHSILPATYDAQTEARDMLWRALSNYGGLQENEAPRPPTSDLMERLQDECIEVLINKEHAERL